MSFIATVKQTDKISIEQMLIFQRNMHKNLIKGPRKLRFNIFTCICSGGGGEDEDKYIREYIMLVLLQMLSMQ